MKKAFILDSSAFLSGYTPGNEGAYTVGEVIEELRSSRARLRAELSLREGRLKIITPPESSRLKEVLKETGDVAVLSKTDLRLLSLALHLGEEGFNPVIITDDYSIQNVAKRLGIEYISTAEKGIRRFIKWRSLCRGCGRVYPASYKGKCSFCGSEVKKRKMNIYKGGG